MFGVTFDFEENYARVPLVKMHIVLWNPWMRTARLRLRPVRLADIVRRVVEHVAIYIGSGRIIHVNNGVEIANVNYRTVYKYARVIRD